MEDLVKDKIYLKKLLTKNKIEKLIVELYELYQNNDQELNEIAVFESNYNLIKKKQDLGTIDDKGFSLEFNKIKLSLLHKIDDLGRKRSKNLRTDQNLFPKIILFIVGTVVLLCLPVSILLVFSSLGLIAGDDNMVLNAIFLYAIALLIWLFLLKYLFWKK